MKERTMRKSARHTNINMAIFQLNMTNNTKMSQDLSER